MGELSTRNEELVPWLLSGFVSSTYASATGVNMKLVAATGAALVDV
jgi:hypothetical protein